MCKTGCTTRSNDPGVQRRPCNALFHAFPLRHRSILHCLVEADAAFPAALVGSTPEFRSLSEPGFSVKAASAPRTSGAPVDQSGDREQARKRCQKPWATVCRRAMPVCRLHRCDADHPEHPGEYHSTAPICPANDVLPYRHGPNIPSSLVGFICQFSFLALAILAIGVGRWPCVKKDRAVAEHLVVHAAHQVGTLRLDENRILRSTSSGRVTGLGSCFMAEV